MSITLHSPPFQDSRVLPVAGFDILAARFEKESPQVILRWAVRRFGDRLTLGTGLGPSGMVLIHMLAEITPAPNLFFLDTELHFSETYRLVRAVEERLQVHIEALRPELSVAEQEDLQGPHPWARDADACCHVRKVAPLRAHLSRYDAWVTGIRRDQGATRAQTPIIHYVDGYDVVKINPLATWTREMVWTYIRAYDLPYNALHEHGYTSIGCMPCTRAVEAGAGERDGRWAGLSKVECGIHTV